MVYPEFAKIYPVQQKIFVENHSEVSCLCKNDRFLLAQDGQGHLFLEAAADSCWLRMDSFLLAQE
jgi:hypothetical protein